MIMHYTVLHAEYNFW